MTCALLGGGKLPSPSGRHKYEVVIPCAEGRGLCVCLVVWVRHPVLGAAGNWAMLGLVYRWKPSWEFLLFNTSWGLEFCGSQGSWT